MSEEQRSEAAGSPTRVSQRVGVQEGCSAGRMPAEFHHGLLTCDGCRQRYPIDRGVPRFVPRDNYATGFGLQWTLHSRTQYDSFSGTTASERRFFDETQWPRDLSGEMILEVGCGSGRFTEQALKTGATVLSMDYSFAVDANYASNGQKENVLIVQADLYRMPFPAGHFDRVFCLGVLQHTPDVRTAFMALPALLKRGGHLAVDVYPKKFTATVLGTKYYVRPFTRSIAPERLYRMVKRWVDAMWPLAHRIGRLPRIGPALSSRLLVPQYAGLGLSESQQKEWAYLDVFDMLAPRFDSPQTAGTLRRWAEEAGLVEVRVRPGYNGIELTGRKP